MKVRRRDQVETREVAESGNLVLLDPTGKQLTVLNPVGAVIYMLIDGERELERIVELVASELSAPPEVVRRDVEAFVADLTARGLLIAEATP